MEYDQELTYFHAACLAHDAVDVFSTLSDCALEPRSHLASQVGISKNNDSHKLDAYLKTGEDFNESVFRTAYGLRGLGMPLKGLKGNVSNLSHYTLQKFQLENINPNKIFVCAAGVENHSEFVDLVSEKLSFIQSAQGQRTSQREASQYVGGEVRNLTQDNSVALALVFQSVNWTSSDLAALNVLNTLLNGSRLQANLLSKNHYIDSARSINFNFSDSGLFGLRVSGAANQAQNVLNETIRTLKDLATPVSADELSRAKNALKVSIACALQRQCDRLEEAVKNQKTFGKVAFDNYFSEIDKVTADQVAKAVQKVLSSAPTFVAQGGEVNKLQSYDQIRNALK